MKTLLFSFMAISVLTLGEVAKAETPGLIEVPGNIETQTANIPTVEYVNKGLITAYQKAKELNTATQTDLNNLSIYVGAPSVEGGAAATGLTKQVEDLQVQISSTAYNGTAGIGIEGKDLYIVGLDADTSTDNKVYVFKNNQARELKIAEDWRVDEE